MEKNLTTGSVAGNMARFSLPFFLSYFLQMLYGMADMFIIGLFCGVEATTAVSIGSQVMHFVTVVLVGLSMGSTVLIGRALGAGDRRTMNQAVGNTITLFALVSAVGTVLLLVNGHHIVSLLSTPQDAVEGTADYLRICFLGVPFITAYNIISSILRGMGDSRSPMIFIAIACAVNILLDYIFIGIAGLGPAGAALGTTLSQSCSVVIALLTIHFKRKKSAGINVTGAQEVLPENANHPAAADYRHFSVACLKPHGRIMKKILITGGPVAAQDGFIQVAFLVLTVIANMRGLTDAAAVGVVEKVIGIFFLVPSSMLSTVSVMSAQNLGAGLTHRARTSLKYGIMATVVFGLACSVFTQFFAEAFVSLFTQDAGAIVAGGQYLRSYIWDCIFAGIHFCFSGFFVACGLSIISFLHNVASIMLRIPMAYFMSVWYPDTLYPMGLASPAGSILSVVICLGAYSWLIRHPEKMNAGS